MFQLENRPFTILLKKKSKLLLIRLTILCVSVYYIMCMGFACIYVYALCVCSALQRSNHLTLELWMGDHELPCGSSGRAPPTELSLQPSSENFKALVFSFKPCHPHFTNSCWPPTQVLNMLSISGLGSKWMKYFISHGSPAPHRCLWTRQHPCTHLTPYSSYEEMLPRT